MKTAAKSKRFRSTLSAVVLGVVVCVIALRAGGVEPASRPASAPSDPATTQAHVPDNISEAAIELTHRQKVALSAVRDGQHWRETAFYMMLARIEELIDPEAAAKEYSSLESPAFGYLTDYPRRYRAQKIRSTMWVIKSRQYVSGSKEWEPHPDWPKGKKLWYMAGVRVFEAPDKPKGKTRLENLVVYSLVDPTKLLGQPVSTGSDGMDFHGARGKALELAAVYYKTFRGEASSSSAAERRYKDYPLVLAYYLKPSSNAGASTSPTGGVVGTLFVVLLALAALLFMVRRQVRRARSAPIGDGGGGTVKYTPLRNIEEDNLPPDEQHAEPVDPALVDAVKAFESKRKKADGTDDKS